ncbi:PRC-barrel domain-containing protein [Caloranaerobacter sp. DY30410]|uniref:PRC-barrel domain-containing protein n=1 Tax=Caloranaerobacter sp. DY30410 TaxID=3238305 RepID=UPI003D054813
MKKASEIIGLPVMTKVSGKKIAVIKDLVFSRKKFRILALMTYEGSVFKEAKIIKYKNVISIGKDVIIVDKENVIESAADIPDIFQLIKERKKIIGEDVITEAGENIGIIKDIIIDEDNGKVLGFILSDGLIQDIMDGRNILPYIYGITFGEDALIISNEIKTEFDKSKEYFKKLLELER